jgi:[ribosomal protein S5]-alanine N-acetyltransferase
VFAYASDPQVTLHMDWPTHPDIAQTREFLAARISGSDNSDEVGWAVTLRSDGAMIGAIGIRPHGHKADFGYVMARRYWGQGFATEAARAVIAEAFKIPEIQRVWATCSIENQASRRVLEKAGLELEGILHAWNVRPQKGGIAEDAYCYAIVRDRRSAQ